MSSSKASSAPLPAQETQKLNSPLTRCAIFLVCSVSNAPGSVQTIRSALAGIAALSKSVAFRDQRANFAVTAAIGSNAWESITGIDRPKELHPLPEFTGNSHSTVSTPGDLLFHIRADRNDLCFEFERLLLDSLGASVETIDETFGFRYFDTRDLLGFVDGTANPTGDALNASVFVTADDDCSAIGGSYVVVQKYLHNLKAWKEVSLDQQESIVGRTKLDNIELADAAKDQQKAHKTLATIQDDDGNEHDILRDNMPFGSPAAEEYGTYFIGYTRKLWVLERMLERMFVGDPPGKHDRILDYSTPVTGTTFFAPNAEFLVKLA